MSFQKLQVQLREGEIRLVDAWIGIESLRQDPFIPAEKISILLVSYRELLEKSQRELKKLEIENKAMRAYIDVYTKEFDALNRQTASNWSRNWSDWGKYHVVYLYAKDPFNNVASGVLVKNEESIMSTLATWKIDNRSSSPVNLQHARSLYDSGLYRQSLEELTRILNLEPTNSVAYLLAGQVYLALGDTESAVAAFKSAIFWEPKQIRAHISLARVYLSQNNRGEAIKYLLTAISIDPKNQEAIDLRREMLQ